MRIIKNRFTAVQEARDLLEYLKGGKGGATPTTVLGVKGKGKNASSKKDTANDKQQANANSRNGAIPHPDPIEVRMRNGETLIFQSSSKHSRGQNGNRPNAGIEPRDSDKIFAQSVQLGRKRYSQDVNGHIHQFHNSNGTWHWAGSTADKNNPLKLADNLKKELKNNGMNGKVLR